MYCGLGIVAVIVLSVCSYLADLYPTQNEFRCFLNEKEKCRIVGNQFADGPKVNEQKAIRYYTKGCNLNDSISCLGLGRVYSRDRNGVKNGKKALSYFEKGCSLDNAESCYVMGIQYAIGTLVKEDPIKQTEAFEKACILKQTNFNWFLDNPTVCYLVASHYLNGEGTNKNITKGMYFLKKDCELKNTDSCLEVAEQYDKVDGVVPINKKEAIKYYQKACELNDFDSVVKLY